MKEPRHDDERLSALLAGRLEGPERDELLAYLSTADEDYEVFADTAAILREMEEEDAQAAEAGIQADPPPRRDALPPSVTKSARGWPRRTPRWAVPLVLVGLVVLGLFVRPGRSASAGSPVQLAASFANPGQPLPSNWARETPWKGATRGEGSPSQDPARAVQAGVFLFRLALAVQAGDSDATVTLAARTRARFDAQGSSPLRQIQARAGQPADSLQPLLEQATKRLEERLDRGYLRLGAWTEAAHLAAVRRDTAFFRTDETRAMLHSAERLTVGDARARAAVAVVRAALPAQGAPDWQGLETSLPVLLQEIAT